jgi:ubiquinone/menaquinone biosynthesis C-methylase UbiE
MIQDREWQLLAMLRRYGVTSFKTSRILEIGCGTGYGLRELIKWGAQPENLTGIDLLAHRVNEARSLCPPAVQVCCGNAAATGFLDAAFDMVFQSTVFTSILDPTLKQQVASEMLRVVKRTGLIVWYDYRVDNPRNLDVRGVNRRELYQLFPGCHIETRCITLAPPLARLLAPYSLLACSLLGRMPWLCTHYLAVIRKGEANAH